MHLIELEFRKPNRLESKGVVEETEEASFSATTIANGKRIIRSHCASV